MPVIELTELGRLDPMIFHHSRNKSSHVAGSIAKPYGVDSFGEIQLLSFAVGKGTSMTSLGISSTIQLPGMCLCFMHLAVSSFKVHLRHLMTVWLSEYILIDRLVTRVSGKTKICLEDAAIVCQPQIKAWMSEFHSLSLHRV